MSYIFRAALFLLISSMAFTETRQPAYAQSTMTIGENAVLTNGDGGNANLLLAQEATLSQTATIDNLSFYVTVAAGKLLLGIYDASGPNGGPGKLLAQTNSFTAVKGWNTQSVISQVSLPAGNYWLAYLPNNNNLNFVKQNNSGNCTYYSHSFGSGLPSTYAKAAAGSWGCTPTTWSFYATLTPAPGGQAVNGACGSSNDADLTSAPTTNLCSAGTASAVTGSGPWNWSCAGVNGGTTAQCMANLLANGACGSANGVAVSSAPTTGLCSAGMASAVTGSGPWNWSCAGSNGGTTASCSAPLQSTVVNGQCGAANGVAVSSAPTSGLCTAGTASTVTGSGPWDWTCAGSDGGTTASCSAPLSSSEVNGACGSANGAITNVAPTGSDLCSAGTASSVSGTGPWTWTCDGSDGGTNTSCEAYAQPQDPGPSVQLYANPYYTCNTNYYVGGPGASDSYTAAQAKNPSTPWATLQNANNTIPQSGGGATDSGSICINIYPSSTPYKGVALSVSGPGPASADGYIVWRCGTGPADTSHMDGCTIDATAGDNGNTSFWIESSEAKANYQIIDGLILTASPPAQTYGAGVVQEGLCCGQTSKTGFSSHHLWVLNDIINNQGEAGIQFAAGDYTYALHNRIYNNANAPSCDNGAQGSGISDVTALDIALGYPNYSPTADDKVNPNPLIGSFAIDSTTWFHKSYSWNVVYNNYVSTCGYDTDGNGIILDTLGWGGQSGGNAVSYPDEILLSFNVVYNNGGGGLHVFGSEFATVANNTCYDNYLDTVIGGSSCMDTNDSYGTTVFNNILYTSCELANDTAVGPDGPGSTTTTTVGSGGQTATATTLTISSATNMPGGSGFSKAFSGLVPPSYALPGGNEIQIGNEIELVTAGWGTATLTVERGYQGTPVAAHASGATVTWIPDYFSNNVTYAVRPCPDVNGPYNGDVYSSTQNREATYPSWVNVGTTSLGSETTTPVGTNFALQPGSPAIGYGMTAPFLPGTSVDAGACSSVFTTCP